MATAQSELVTVYEDLRAALTLLLRTARTAGGVDGVPTAFIVRQLTRISDDLDRVRGLEAEFVRGTIEPTFRASTQAASDTIRQAGFRLTQDAPTALEIQTIRQLTVRLTRDLAAVRVAISKALALNDPKRLGPRAVARALEADGAVRLVRGEARVQTPAGSLWKVDAYAKMLTRTAVADARREAFRTRYLANGLDVVYVVPNGTDHPVCAAWEGRLLSITGATPGVPTIDDARSAGLFHPQCRHRYVAATPDRLEDAGLPMPELPRAGAARAVEPTAPLPTLGIPAPGVPGATYAPTAVPNPRQPSLRSVSPELLRAAARRR